eukprot:805317-Prymnesium_polylepis.1
MIPLRRRLRGRSSDDGDERSADHGYCGHSALPAPRRHGMIAHRPPTYLRLARQSRVVHALNLRS